MKKTDTTKEESPSKNIRTLSGTVVRRSGDKTVAVKVNRVTIHPRYHKRVTKTKKYLAHDPANEYEAGDSVVLKESRPLSARKRWQVMPKEKSTK